MPNKKKYLRPKKIVNSVNSLSLPATLLFDQYIEKELCRLAPQMKLIIETHNNSVLNLLVATNKALISEDTEAQEKLRTYVENYLNIAKLCESSFKLMRKFAKLRNQKYRRQLDQKTQITNVILSTSLNDDMKDYLINKLT